MKLHEAGNLPSLRWLLIECMLVATLNFFLCRFLFLRYRDFDSGGYLSLLEDCLSPERELLTPLAGWFSRFLSLEAASSRTARVSLLILLIGMGVPVVGALKAVLGSTSKWLIPDTKALSLAFMVTQ